MLFRTAINATTGNISLGQSPHNSGARRWLSAVSNKFMRRSYLYGTPSFAPPSPPLLMEPVYRTISSCSFRQDAKKILGNAFGRDRIRPRGQRSPPTNRQGHRQGSAAEFPLREFTSTTSAPVRTLTVQTTRRLRSCLSQTESLYG